MIDSIRTRLAIWHCGVVAVLQIVFCIAVYLILKQSIYKGVDAVLSNVNQDVVANLDAAAAKSRDPSQVANASLGHLYHSGSAFAIYDTNGKLLAERPNGVAQRLAPFPRNPAFLSGERHLYTWHKEIANWHRVEVSCVATAAPNRMLFVVVTSHMLDPMLADIHVVRKVFLIASPTIVLVAGICGWLLARKSLVPVVTMAEKARRIGQFNDRERLAVVNPRDELGRLASAFNRLLDRLSEALSHQRQFMADAAHELRTPISVIRTATEVTLDQTHSEEADYREALQIALGQARHLSRTVDDVFRLARSDMGRETLRLTNIYLDELVREEGQSAEVLARARGVRVLVDEIEEAPFRGDGALLSQMVRNLLSNSIKFTPAGGKIRLALTRHNGQYHICVQDNGVGIRASAQGQIFERFYKDNASLVSDDDAAFVGSGLGLSIARWVAEAHRGALTLQSSSAEGSTFIAVLPIPERCLS